MQHRLGPERSSYGLMTITCYQPLGQNFTLLYTGHETETLNLDAAGYHVAWPARTGFYQEYLNKIRGTKPKEVLQVMLS